MSARTPARTLPALTLLAGAVALALAPSAFSQSAPRRAQRGRTNTARHADNGDNGNTDSGSSTAVRSATAEPGTFRAPQTSGGNANVSSGQTAANGSQPSSEELRANRGAPTAAEQETGPIGPADVARLVQGQMPRLRPCYENARPAHPNLVGRVELRFTIGADGRVTQAAALGMPDAPEVSDCLRGVLLQTTFPRPVSSPLQFAYPVTFVPEPTPPARGRGARAAHPARPARAATH